MFFFKNEIGAARKKKLQGEVAILEWPKSKAPRAESRGLKTFRGGG